MRRIGLKFMMYFDPMVTRWSTQSDFEHDFAKFLSLKGLEAQRIEIFGSPELVMVIQAKKILSTEPKLHKGKPAEIQVENLKKGIRGQSV